MAYRTKICDEGGMYNASRPATYSAETRALLNDLIKESRLTTLQRNSIQGWLRSGGGPPATAVAPTRVSNASAEPIKRYRSTRPRTLKDIVESGAYEPEVYSPNTRLRNYNVEKEKLQSIMAFGKGTTMNPTCVLKKNSVKKTSKEECTEKELIDSVMSDIEDREKFLSDMDSLGQGSKYSAFIIHEICDRIKKLEAFVSKSSCIYRTIDVQNIAKKYRKPLGSPKTLPASLSSKKQHAFYDDVSTKKCI